MPKTFYKTTITVHVLSEDAPLEWDDLKDVAYAITDGDCVGLLEDTSAVAMTEEQAREFCDQAGTDFDFF